MRISRTGNSGTAYSELGKRAASIREACLGCKSCEGLCFALAEVLSVPDLVLKGFDE